MTIPTTTRFSGGPFDRVYQIGSSARAMGFMSPSPPLEQSIDNLAPNIRIGGDPGYQETAYNQWVLDSFHLGGDRQLYESGDQRYQWSDGEVALHKEKRVTLSSQWAVEDSSITATARQIVDFPAGNQYICVAEGTNIRAYDVTGDSWGDQGTFASNAIYLYANDEYLFVACGSGDDFWRWSGAAWVQPAATVKANVFSWYNETLYMAYANKLYAATNNDGSAWAAGINIGWDSTDIEDLIVAQGYLLIAKPEGLYLYDGSTVTVVIDAQATRTTGNFVGSCEFEGNTYLLWLNTVRKANVANAHNATFTDMTPRMMGDSNKEKYGHGKGVRAFAGPNFLYCAFDDGESVYPELLAHNGIGWHQIYRGTSGATMRAAGFSRLMGWLLINDGSTRRKRVLNVSDDEYPDYNANGVFTLPDYDAGFPDTRKSFRDITIDARDVDSDNTILVEYRADDGEWTTIATISAEGTNTMTLSGASGQISAYRIGFRLTLTRKASDVTKTPVIEMPMTVRVMVKPVATHAFEDNIYVDLDPALHNGYGQVRDAYTITEMLDFLDEMEDSGATITRVDEFGRRKMVTVTSLARRDERPASIDSTVREKAVFNLRFLEVFSGLSRYVSNALTCAGSLTTTLQTAGFHPGYGRPGFVSIGGSS